METTREKRRRTQLFTGRGELVVYAAFMFVSLMLIVLPDSLQRRMASHVEDFALYPFRRTVQASERIVEVWESKRRLSEEVESLRLELARTEEVRLENRRLREMLDLSRRPGLSLIGCEILGEGGGRFGDRTILLDRGYRHGIRRDMPITGRDGLAGKVVEVYPETARAILLTHRLSAASVRDRRSRVTGVAEWNPGSASSLKLRGLTYLADVAAGDTLVTSGLGGIFPEGLTVGTVGEIEPDDNGLLLDVTVIPAVEFTKLEEVFAILESPAGESPVPEVAADGGAARSSSP